MEWCALGLGDAALAIRDGRLTSAELVKSCIARVREVDDAIGAWAFLDEEHAVRQAESADDHRMHGRSLGPLHGVPVGVTDIFDTSDYPTELGSPLWKGRTPRRDATVVARLRSAGAVILGKTTTTEYAYRQPAKTRNPHDPSRTSGSAACGAAAAVASLMVPAAIGLQTDDAVIGAASYCGIVGFKPTHGLVPRSGALVLSRTLDQVGVLARSVEDAALLADTLVGYDEDDADTRPLASPCCAAVAASEPPLPPRLAFVKGAAWRSPQPVLDDAFAELMATLGGIAEPVDLGAAFERAGDLHGTIMSVEMAHNLRRDYDKGADVLSASLREMIERGRGVGAVDYLNAMTGIELLNATLNGVFDEFDALLTAAAPGEAPAGPAAAADSGFCSIWTYLGTPSVSLPLLRGHALPIGVQLVARRGNDARLLRTARWLDTHVRAPARRRRQAVVQTSKSRTSRISQRRPT